MIDLLKRIDMFLTRHGPVIELGSGDSELSLLVESRRELNGARTELTRVVDAIDDFLYDPHWKPIDEATGEVITGMDYYYLDHEIQYDHLPALRQWFIRQHDLSGTCKWSV